MTDKLSIANEMKMFDHKVRDFYDELSEDERKKFAPFLMIRWGSAVEGSRDLPALQVRRDRRHGSNNNQKRT